VALPFSVAGVAVAGAVALLLIAEGYVGDAEGAYEQHRQAVADLDGTRAESTYGDVGPAVETAQLLQGVGWTLGALGAGAAVWGLVRLRAADAAAVGWRLGPRGALVEGRF